MADTKISGLAALATGELVDDDFFVVVDDSDTTMAATGTNKLHLASSVRDYLSASLSLAGPHDVPVGAVAQTFSRVLSFGSSTALTSGTLYLSAIGIPAGKTITSISFRSGGSGATSPTNQWFGLFDSSLNKLEVTGNDTTTAWASTTTKTLNLASPYVTTYAGLYYIGICVTSSGGPTIYKISLTVASLNDVLPVAGGTSSTGLTDPASCPSTAASITKADIFYGYVS